VTTGRKATGEEVAEEEVAMNFIGAVRVVVVSIQACIFLVSSDSIGLADFAPPS
jgi:hypothetical protein